MLPHLFGHAIEPPFSTLGGVGVNTSKSFQAAMAAAGQVLTITLSVALGAWLGWTLDAKLGWSNVLMLLLPGLGFIASLFIVYRAYIRAQETHDEPPTDAT
jgi:F0F1-type ATP synthase assembly protein I